MTDIISRLLDEAEKAQRKGHLLLVEVCRDASDRIGLLEHDNERLRAEIVLLEATGAECADEIERLRAQADRWDTEAAASKVVIERLQEALDHTAGFAMSLCLAEGREAAAEIERLRADLLQAEMRAEMAGLENILNAVARGRREGIEAAAQAAENCLHPSAERTAHAAVDDAVAAIRALLTEAGR